MSLCALREKFDGLVFISRGELSGAQISARGGRVIAEAFGQFGHGDVAIAIFRIELRDAHEARQRIFSLAAQFVCQCGGGELLDGLFGAILLLQQQGVARHAFGGLLVRLQEASVQGQRLGLLRAGAVKRSNSMP